MTREGGVGISARDAFAQVAGYYRHEPTLFEVGSWDRLINEFGDEAVSRFLFRHMERSSFMPKVNEALELLDPHRGSDMQLLERLRDLVCIYGPYKTPVLADKSMALAISKLGGWVKVNEDLPDPSNDFLYSAYFKRFQAARREAEASLVRDPALPVPAPAGLIGTTPQAVRALEVS